MFALVALAFSARHVREPERAPGPSMPAALSVGAMVGTVFWNPFGSTWANRCFTLAPEGGPFFDPSWALFILAVAAYGAGAFAFVAHRLKKRAAVLREVLVKGEGPALRRLALWCGGAGVLWTIANETLLVRFASFARRACDPDVGLVAVAAYSAAGVLLWRVCRRRSERIARESIAVAVLFGLGAAQLSLTAAHWRWASVELRACGGFVSCNCCDRWGWDEPGRLF